MKNLAFTPHNQICEIVRTKNNNEEGEMTMTPKEIYCCGRAEYLYD